MEVERTAEVVRHAAGVRGRQRGRVREFQAERRAGGGDGHRVRGMRCRAADGEVPLCEGRHRRRHLVSVRSGRGGGVGGGCDGGVRQDGGGALDVLAELLHITLQLGSTVLEPGDHLEGRRNLARNLNLSLGNPCRTYLGVGKSERRSDLVSVGGREVFLVEEPLLQLEDLVVGEGRPRLPLLLRVLLVRKRQLGRVQF